MSVIDVGKLLLPVSPETPAGENLQYDPLFLQMEQAAQPKPEREVGGAVTPAEEPDWKEVRRKALDILARSRDLRPSVHLTRALVATDGFPGLRDGLALVRGLLENHWDTLHPQLDPEDDNDPTMRVNALVALCHPETTLRGVRQAPLVTSRAHGRFSLRDVLIATGKMPPAAADGPQPEPAAIEAAFTECGLEALQETAEAIAQSLEHAEAVELLLMQRVGAERTVDLSALTSVLESAHRVVAERLARRGVQVSAVGAGSEFAEAGAGAGAGRALSGEIASREDVIRALDQVCEFFARTEPSSPVPLLLRRAKRLISKNFLEIVRDLAPDAVAQVELIRGTEGGES